MILAPVHRATLVCIALVGAGAAMAGAADGGFELPKVSGYQARVVRAASHYVLAYDQFDTPAGPRRIFVAVSPDGRKWEAPARVGKEGLSIAGPSVAVGLGGKLSLFATGTTDGKSYRPCLATSADGRTWSDFEPVTLPPVGASVLNGHLTSRRDGSLLLAYQFSAEGRSQVGVATSRDGKEWAAVGAPVPLRMRPFIVEAKEGTLHLVYQGRTAQGAFELFMRKSAGTGGWTDEVQATRDANSHDGFLTVEKDRLELHYISTRGMQKQFDLQEAVSKDGGVTWSWVEELSQTPGSEYAPALVHTAAGERHLVYSLQEGFGVNLRSMPLDR